MPAPAALTSPALSCVSRPAAPVTRAQHRNQPERPDAAKAEMPGLRVLLRWTSIRNMSGASAVISVELLRQARLRRDARDEGARPTATKSHASGCGRERRTACQAGMTECWPAASNQQPPGQHEDDSEAETSTDDEPPSTTPPAAVTATDRPTRMSAAMRQSIPAEAAFVAQCLAA